MRGASSDIYDTIGNFNVRYKLTGGQLNVGLLHVARVHMTLKQELQESRAAARKPRDAASVLFC